MWPRPYITGYTYCTAETEASFGNRCPVQASCGVELMEASAPLQTNNNKNNNGIRRRGGGGKRDVGVGRGVIGRVTLGIQVCLI